MGMSQSSGSQNHALRLIANRGEGLAKMIRSPFSLDHEPLPAIQDSFNYHWNFLFTQIADPAHQRPQPINAQAGQFAWDPLQQKEVTPAELADDKNLEHTCMTSTSLLPRDGKMELFGTNSHTGNIGLLFDVRKCDLKGERFVFKEDACSDNNWWFDPNAKAFQARFRGYTINEMRAEAKLEETVEGHRDYNEVKAGVNANALSAILLQPTIPSNAHSEQGLLDRFNAIYRKIYVAGLLNRHIPIIIVDANRGIKEYTLEEQTKDLESFLKKNSNNLFCRFLLEQNTALIKSVPLEIESPTPANIPHQDLQRMQRIQNLLQHKITTLSDQKHLLKEILNLQEVLTEYVSTEEDSELHQIRLQHLNKLYNFTITEIMSINQQLENLAYKGNEYLHLEQLIKQQEYEINKLTNPDYEEKLQHKHSLNHKKMQSTLADTNNRFIKDWGLVYSLDAKSKAGLAQLYQDFCRKLEVSGRRHHADPINTLDDFENYLKQGFTLQEIELLKQHYSQGPLLFMTAPLQTFSIGKGLSLKQPEGADLSMKLYKKDNEIYICCTAEKYPIVNQEDRELVDYLPASAECTFKLTDKGFAFQEMKTNSDFIKDIYLGKEVNSELLTQHITTIPNALAIIKNYKTICNDYLTHLIACSPEPSLTKKMDIMRELIAILHSNDCGLFETKVNPLSLRSSERMVLLGKCSAGYIFFEDKLFYLDNKAKCIDLDVDVNQLANFKNQINYSPLGENESSQMICDNLTSVDLNRISNFARHYHEQQSPTAKIHQFTKYLDDNAHIITATRDNAITTFLKASGVVAASVATVGFYGKTAYQALFKQTKGQDFLDQVKQHPGKS